MAIAPEIDRRPHIVVVDAGWHPTWSSNGKWVAFVREQTEGFRIWKVNVATGRRKLLTEGLHNDTNPSWHPRKSRLVIESDGAAAGRRKLYLLEADGSRRRPLITRPVPFFSETEPAWSPDGGQVAFVGKGDSGGEVWIVNADGTGVRQVTHFSPPAER